MINDEKVKDYLCLALNLDSKNEILNFVDDLSDLIGYFKINYAFTRFGPDLIKKIKSRGVKVFLDLKLHDIPNTIVGYAKSIMDLEIDIITIHTSGGSEMMESFMSSIKKI